MENKVNYEIKNIKIYDIPGFFIHERIRRILALYNIITLEDFFNTIENTNLITMTEPTSVILIELLASFKLLSCKYLGYEPHIAINDSMLTEEIINALGLSYETGYELNRMKRDKKLFKRLSKMHLEEKILYFGKNSNMSELSQKEIAYKLQIIDDYNNKRVSIPILEDLKKTKPIPERDLEGLRATVNLLPRARGSK